MKHNFGAQAYELPEYLKITTKEQGPKYATKFIISLQEFRLGKDRIFKPIFKIELYE